MTIHITARQTAALLRAARLALKSEMTSQEDRGHLLDMLGEVMNLERRMVEQIVEAAL